MAVVKNIAPLNIKPIYISWASGNCYQNCINVATLFLHSQYRREYRLIFVNRIITYDGRVGRCMCCICT